MGTFAQESKATQQADSAQGPAPHRARVGQLGDVNSSLDSPHTIDSQAGQRRRADPEGFEAEAEADTSVRNRFGHSFGQISVYPSVPMQLQTKLVVNTPGDRYEQEADLVSEQVMRMPEPQLQRDCPCGGSCPTCQSKQPIGDEANVETKRVGPGDLGQTAVPLSVRQGLRSPGQPLDPAARAFMEPRFGYDFSAVRVHTDGRAGDSARSLKARAFTTGQDIFFQQGEYNPNSRAGQQLLAHELTHVVQQESAGPSAQIQRAPEGGSEEPVIASTPDNTTEMWKNVIAHRHFQGKGSAGNVTFAAMRIVDKEGRTVVNILTESDKSSHAEEKAIRIARKQITDGRLKVESGKIIFVVDQTVCSKAGRCRDQITKLAKDFDMEVVNATYVSRAETPAESKRPNKPVLPPGGTGAGPKATAKKVQKVEVEGLARSKSTETIYKRSRGSVTPAGGSAKPVTSASGEIKVPQRGSVTPAGGLAKPVTSASGEIKVPQRGSVTPAGGSAKPVTSASGEITSKGTPPKPSTKTPASRGSVPRTSGSSRRTTGRAGGGRGGGGAGIGAVVLVFAELAISKLLQESYADDIEKAAREQITKEMEGNRDEFNSYIESRNSEIQAHQTNGLNVTLHVVIRQTWQDTDIGRVAISARVHSKELVFEGGPPPKPDPVWAMKGNLKNAIVGTTIGATKSYMSIDLPLEGTDLAARHQRLSREKIDALLDDSAGGPVVEYEELILKSFHGGLARTDLRDYAAHKSSLAEERRDLAARKYWQQMEALTTAPIDEVIAEAKVKSIPLDDLRAYATGQAGDGEDPQGAYGSEFIVDQIDAPLAKRYQAARQRYLWTQPAPPEEVAEQKATIASLESALVDAQQRLAEASKVVDRGDNEPPHADYAAQYPIEQEIKAIKSEIWIETKLLDDMENPPVRKAR